LRCWQAKQGLIAGLIAMVCLPAASNAATARRIYVDRANGVSFSYPAAWLLNADDDAATAKLRIVSAAQPGAVVQLEGNFADEGPYKGTDFEAGAFAYVVVPNETEAKCFEILAQDTQDAQQPVATRWNGLAARKLDAKYSVAGTDDTHHIVAAYNRGSCYLFETVVVSKDADGILQPLKPARWNYIRAQFDGVLQSVQIHQPSTMTDGRLTAPGR
jgi:hypothetical protein